MHEAQSPRVDDAGIERRLAGSPAPRVTLDDVMNNIIGEYYFTAAEGYFGMLVATFHHDDGRTVSESLARAGVARAVREVPQPLQLLTICVLVLRNGYTVTGLSACASPENFDAQVGRDIARRNAIEQVWPLLGYELKTNLTLDAMFRRAAAVAHGHHPGGEDRPHTGEQHGEGGPTPTAFDPHGGEDATVAAVVQDHHSER